MSGQKNIVRTSQPPEPIIEANMRTGTTGKDLFPSQPSVILSAGQSASSTRSISSVIARVPLIPPREKPYHSLDRGAIKLYRFSPSGKSVQYVIEVTRSDRGILGIYEIGPLRLIHSVKVDERPKTSGLVTRCFIWMDSDKVDIPESIRSIASIQVMRLVCDACLEDRFVFVSPSAESNVVQEIFITKYPLGPRGIMPELKFAKYALSYLCIDFQS